MWYHIGLTAKVQPLRPKKLKKMNIEHRTSNVDGIVKSLKRANFQILNLIISIGYEITIREF